MATKVILQEATLHNCAPLLRSNAGTSITQLKPIIIRSNTTWKLIIDSGDTWLHLDSSLTDAIGISGDAHVKYTWDENIGDATREAKITVVVADDPTRILKVFYIRQKATPEVLKFRPTDTAGIELPDQMVGAAATSLSLYVYTKFSSTDWGLITPTPETGDVWATSPVFNTEGSDSTPFTVTIAENTTAVDRYIELFLASKGTGEVTDVLKIFQAASVAKSTCVSIAAGGPGTWNATTLFDKVKLSESQFHDGKDGSGSNSDLTQNTSNRTRERTLRRSANTRTEAAGYFIMGQNSHLTETDSQGNSTFSVGREENHHLNNYTKDTRERGNWNIESISQTTSMAAPAIVQSEQQIFSYEPIKNAVASSAGASFISTTLLKADYILSAAQTLHEEDLTAAEYKAGSETTVLLWNLFDGSDANSYNTTANRNFDYYDIPEYDVASDSYTYTGIKATTFNPLNIPDPWDRDAGLFQICELTHFNVLQNLKINTRFAWSKSGTKAVELVLLNNKEAQLTPIEIELSDGSNMVIEAYEYHIKEVRIKTDVPTDLVIGVQTTSRRGTVVFNDVYEIDLTVTYVGAPNTEGGGQSYKLHYRLDLDRTGEFDRILTVILAVIYSIAAIVVALVTFGVGGILLAKISSVIGVILFAVGIAELAVGAYNKYLTAKVSNYVSSIMHSGISLSNWWAVWSTSNRTMQQIFYWFQENFKLFNKFSKPGTVRGGFKGGWDFTPLGKVVGLAAAAAYAFQAAAYWDELAKRDWNKVPPADKWVSGVAFGFNIKAV